MVLRVPRGSEWIQARGEGTQSSEGVQFILTTKNTKDEQRIVGILGTTHRENCGRLL